MVALLEAGIAACGMLIPIALPLVQQAYLSVVGYGFNAVLLRAAVCAIVLTPPTMLMGATLPVVARLPNADVGRLYTCQPDRRRSRYRAGGLLLAARIRCLRRQRHRDRD